MEDDFLSNVAHIPDSIGEATPPTLAPVPGLPEPIDPLRPWRDVNVDVYLPLAIMLLKKAFSVAASKTGEQGWELDDFEVDSLRDALREAVQKCLYDLRLAKLASNPYVALVVAVGTLAGVKYIAIEASRMLKAAEKKEPTAGVSLPSSNREDLPSPLPTRPVSSMTSTRTPDAAAVSSSAGSQGAGSPILYDSGSDEDDE